MALPPFRRGEQGALAGLQVGLQVDVYLLEQGTPVRGFPSEPGCSVPERGGASGPAGTWHRAAGAVVSVEPLSSQMSSWPGWEEEEGVGRLFFSFPAAGSGFPAYKVLFLMNWHEAFPAL